MKNSDLKILQEKYDDILNEAGWFTRQKARLSSLNPFDKENLKNIKTSIKGMLPDLDRRKLLKQIENLSGKFEKVVGDSVQKKLVIKHNLNSKDLSVTAYSIKLNKKLKHSFSYVDDDTIEIKFLTIPKANDVRVVIKTQKYLNEFEKLKKKLDELDESKLDQMDELKYAKSGLRSKRVVSLLNSHWKDLHKLLSQIKEDLKSVNIGLSSPQKIDDVFNEDELSRDIIEMLLNQINLVKTSPAKNQGLYQQHKPMMPPK